MRTAFKAASKLTSLSTISNEVRTWLSKNSLPAATDFLQWQDDARAAEGERSFEGSKR